MLCVNVNLAERLTNKVEKDEQNYLIKLKNRFIFSFNIILIFIKKRTLHILTEIIIFKELILHGIVKENKVCSSPKKSGAKLLYEPKLYNFEDEFQRITWQECLPLLYFQ